MSKLLKMQLAIADVALNEGKPAKRMLVLFNETGTLLIDEELFSISFTGAIPSEVKINYLESIKI